MPVGRALRDGEGRFTGFLAATFQPERLRGFYAAIGIGPAGIIRLIDRDGDLLFSQHHSRPSSNSGVGHQPLLEAVRSGAATRFARVPSGADGLPYCDPRPPPTAP